MEEIKMKTPEGKEVMIDEAMAPIINLFWQRGIHTKFCCAGHPYLEGKYGPFQTYVTFDFKDANYLRDSIESLMIFCDINPGLEKFITGHFNISIDMCQSTITIEAIASEYDSWLRIMNVFYRLADRVDNVACRHEEPDVRYWVSESYQCVNINGEDDKRQTPSIFYAFPHIKFNFFVHIPDENEEIDEVYLSMDRDYVYSTCHTIKDITNDDRVILKPAVMHKHNVKITEEFVNSLTKPMSKTDFISIFGFEPFE